MKTGEIILRGGLFITFIGIALAARGRFDFRNTIRSTKGAKEAEKMSLITFLRLLFFFPVNLAGQPPGLSETLERIIKRMKTAWFIFYVGMSIVMIGAFTMINNAQISK